MSFSTKTAEHLALSHYNIQATATPLVGEVDFNFRLKTAENQQFCLKISRSGADLEEIEFQQAFTKHLNVNGFPLQTPLLVVAKNGAEIIKLQDDRGETHFLRLQTWVDGKMVAEAKPKNEALLFDWGRTAGLMSNYAQGFDHPKAHRFYKWNPSETLHSMQYYGHLDGDEKKMLAAYFWNHFKHHVLPKLPTLRKSVNHNDLHELNVCCMKLQFGTESKMKLQLRQESDTSKLDEAGASSYRVNGIIDFGDALYCETINELAIAMAYGCMDLPDPLQAACAMLRGYHSVFAVEEKELEVLYGLVSARLLITVSNAAVNRAAHPENEYLSISEQSAWDLLWKWVAVKPDFAECAFRNAVGLVPRLQTTIFEKWAAMHTEHFAPLIAFSDKKVATLDLSVGSLELGNNANFEEIELFSKQIKAILGDKQAEIGIGGYLETRPIYTTEAYKVEGNNGPQWRTVHLGTDIWTKAETPIFAPLEGKIHSFQDNDAERDYGPTIILEHQYQVAGNTLIFYTLYGHLSRTSLNGKRVGQRIQKGEAFAAIGAPPENGNWPPHLHFQVIMDMLEKKGDFPGVAYPQEVEVWKNFCPDPKPFLSGFPSHFSNIKAKDAAGIQAQRKKQLGKNLSLSYCAPLHIVRGYKQYLYTTDGRRYLDTVNNVAHVGHEHPKVVRAAQRQTAVLNTNTRYLHQNIVDFSEKLLATFPPELCVCYLVNSGSEANELALRLARTWSKQRDMIALEIGYHGNTGGCIDISSYKFDGKGGSGAPEHTQIVPMPNAYRDGREGQADLGQFYAKHIENAVKTIHSKGRNAAGFIAESILSCGGQVPLPEGYLQAAYQAVRQAGGLCIADEVQTGFGRVGKHFWAFELQGVVPDIVTIGKPIGNGHPLAAVVTTRAVAEAFTNGMEYFNTFGGNPVSCAIGSAVLDVIFEEKLQENAQIVGDFFKNELKSLQNRHPIIGDVRGEGLFLGFELVHDNDPLKPATAEAIYLSNRMRELGILTSTDGPHENVIKIKPPLCFTKENVEEYVGQVDLVLGEI